MGSIAESSKQIWRKTQNILSTIRLKSSTQVSKRVNSDENQKNEVPSIWKSIQTEPNHEIANEISFINPSPKSRESSDENPKYIDLTHKFNYHFVGSQNSIQKKKSKKKK